MDGGCVGPEHVKIIVETMAKVPAKVAAEDRDLCEATLVDTAIDCDPNFLGNAAQRILDRVDPDGDIDDTTPASKMEFHFGTRSTRTGLTPIKGQLDDHGVEVVKKAIDALSAPRPDGSRDQDGDAVQDVRPAANRRAHGLIEALGRYLDAGIGPIQGGERPHVTITMNWDALTGLISNASFDSGAMISPAQARRFLCDAQVIPMILGSQIRSPRRRPSVPHLPRAHPPGHHRPRPGMRLAGLRSAAGLVRRPPHRILAAGLRRHQLCQRVSPVSAPSHRDSQTRMGHPHGPRRDARVHPAEMVGSDATTTPQHPTKIRPHTELTCFTPIGNGLPHDWPEQYADDR